MSSPYKLIIPKRVQKQLKSIPEDDALKILEKLKQLASCSLSLNIKKLAGFVNLYRFRHGNYRVVYEIQDTKMIIYVIALGHRKEIYQKLKKLF